MLPELFKERWDIILINEWIALQCVTYYFREVTTQIFLLPSAHLIPCLGPAICIVWLVNLQYRRGKKRFGKHPKIYFAQMGSLTCWWTGEWEIKWHQVPFCSQKAVTTEQVRKDEKQLSVLPLSSSDLKSRCNWANSHAINLLGISDQAPCFSKALKMLCRQLPISMGNSDFCFFFFWPVLKADHRPSSRETLLLLEFMSLAHPFLQITRLACPSMTFHCFWI